MTNCLQTVGLKQRCDFNICIIICYYLNGAKSNNEYYKI